MLNADKPQRGKADIGASVDMFNDWFMRFAPLTYREKRTQTAVDVKEAIELLRDMRSLTPEALKSYPKILATLRMSTAPPIGRDRLAGLSHVPPSLVRIMEVEGRLPRSLRADGIEQSLAAICDVIRKLLDEDIFPWLPLAGESTEATRARASTIVADRLTGSLADPLIRNAQEQRQLAAIEEFLGFRGYRRQPPPRGSQFTDMEPGTYTFRLNIPVGAARQVNMPIDVVIQPHRPRRNRLPILMEAKSAGDFTNTNKRRKEEATKIRQLRETYGEEIQLTLLLCGYFDGGYLGYEAAEGLDWIWEHRLEDMLELGI